MVGLSERDELLEKSADQVGLLFDAVGVFSYEYGGRELAKRVLVGVWVHPRIGVLTTGGQRDR